MTLKLCLKVKSQSKNEKYANVSVGAKVRLMAEEVLSRCRNGNTLIVYVCVEQKKLRCIYNESNRYDQMRRRWMRAMDGPKRHSLQAMDLLLRLQIAMQIVWKLPAPNNGSPITVFLGQVVRADRWMAGAAPHKSG